MDFSPEQFERTLKRLTVGRDVAVGVSGGPDSMALLWLLSGFAQNNNIHLYAYTIDHDLRADSADEARMVGEWVRSWPCVSHHILKWEGEKPQTRILEEARKARYALISEAMARVGVDRLFIAHHRDDQAETFLIRLAKGSGLDGLAGMREIHRLENGIELVRPLLDFSKEDLIEICQNHQIPFVRDPTNANVHYLRPRLRAAKEILEEEGLSAKRLTVTAKRFLRAKNALDNFTNLSFLETLIEKDDVGFLFNFNALKEKPEEILLRLFLKVINELQPVSDYGPRLERLEELLDRCLNDSTFKAATLGGCLFALDRKNGTLWIGRE